MRLQLETSARERRRSQASRCQVVGCSAPAAHRIEIQLPNAWDASDRYTTLTVVAFACDECARELERRAHALIDARADIPNLVQIVDGAIDVERDLRSQLEASLANGAGGAGGTAVWPEASPALAAIDGCDHRWVTVDHGQYHCAARCHVVIEGALAASPPERGMDWGRAVLVVRDRAESQS